MYAEESLMNPQMNEFVWSVALRTPVILISVGGIIWAIVNWKQASTSALFATIACTVLLLGSCVFPALLAWVPSMLLRNADGIEAFRWSIRGIIGTWNVCSALCVGALIFAVFAGRAAAEASSRPERRPARFDEDDDRTIDDRIRSN
jgi:hypothetical protein